MRISHSVSAVFCSFALTAPLFAADDATVELPKDPKKAVITMNYEGGFRRAPRPTIGPDGKPRIEAPKPFLVVLADGTVLKQGKPVEAKKMTTDELKKLLSFIVVENEFFDFSAAKVDAAIKAKDEAFRKKQEELRKKGGPIIARPRPVGGLPVDMATTVITVELGDKKNTAKCYGYSFRARQQPDIEPIQQMNRIEQRLQSLAR